MQENENKEIVFSTELEKNEIQVQTTEQEETIITNNEEQAKKEQVVIIEPTAEKTEEEKEDKAALDGVYNPAASESNKIPQKGVFFETLEGSVNFVDKKKENEQPNINKDEDFVSVLEKNREIFYSSYKKSQIIGTILGGISFALIVIALIVVISISGKEGLSWIIYLLIGITGATCIASMVVISLKRKQLSNKFQDYLQAYTRTVASAAYCNVEGVTDAKISVGSKVVDKDVFAAHYYNTIININSRHRIECNYLNHKLSDCEISVLVPNEIPETNKKAEIVQPVKETTAEQVTTEQPTETTEKVETVETKEQEVKEKEIQAKKTFESNHSGPITALYGKFISYDLALNNREGIIIVIASQSTYFPTNLKNFQEYSIAGLNENIYVYATDEAFANKLLNDNVKQALNDITVDSIMTDAFISMNSAGTKIGINYCDDVIVVPVEKFPSREIVEHYPHDVRKFLHLLKVIQE